MVDFYGLEHIRTHLYGPLWTLCRHDESKLLCQQHKHISQLTIQHKTASPTCQLDGWTPTLLLMPRVSILLGAHCMIIWLIWIGLSSLLTLCYKSITVQKLCSAIGPSSGSNKKFNLSFLLIMKELTLMMMIAAVILNSFVILIRPVIDIITLIQRIMVPEPWIIEM